MLWGGGVLIFLLWCYLLTRGYLQFAKHFKVAEQVEFLKKNRTGIAVGTPARLMDLLDTGNSPLLSLPKSPYFHGVSSSTRQRVTSI